MDVIDLYAKWCGLGLKEQITVLSNIATAAAVVIAAGQLWITRRQAKTTFEDTFAREYRELAAKFPTKALLGEALTHKEYCEAFDEFYHYFDLCNTQIFLHQQRRISKKTWKYWRDGMEANFTRPAFKRAWSEIAVRAEDDFRELKNEFPPAQMNNNEACKNRVRWYCSSWHRSSKWRLQYKE